MNSNFGHRTTVLLGLLALCAVVIGARGAWLYGKNIRWTAALPHPVATSTEYDVSSWTEHKGKYRIIESDGVYKGLIEDCHFSFRFPKGQMRYDAFFGMDEPAPVTEYCDARFYVNGKTEAEPVSGLFLSYIPGQDGARIDHLAEYEAGFKNFPFNRVQEGRLTVGGKPALQATYAYKTSAEREPYDQRRTIITWVEDAHGTLEVRWDGYPGQEELYRTILSTVSFY
ncbi:hypothetical protein M0Q28_00460 [Patescibacteria group bacterium]|jgi:hypothetical protein|nr:hypothetical protein [Patescibacteria group bacterium]